MLIGMQIPALICLVAASAMAQSQTVDNHQKPASGERVPPVAVPAAGAGAGESAALPLSSAPTQPSPKLAPMGFLAGNCWRGTLPDGKSVDTHCFEWLLNGHYLHDHHVVRSPGGPDYVGESLYYFDHERQQVAYLYYESLGNYARGLMIGDARKLEFPQAEFFHPGGKMTYRARWERLDEGSLQATSEFLKAGKWVLEQSVKFVKVPR